MIGLRYKKQFSSLSGASDVLCGADRPPEGEFFLFFQKMLYKKEKICYNVIVL